MLLRSGKVINQIQQSNDNTYYICNHVKNYIDNTFNELLNIPSCNDAKEDTLNFIRLWGELYYYVSTYLDELKDEKLYLKELVIMGKIFKKYVDNLNIYDEPYTYSEQEYRFIYKTRKEVLNVVTSIKNIM